MGLASPIPKTRLADLDDTNLSGLADGNTLSYVAATGKWVPSIPAGGGGGITTEDAQDTVAAMIQPGTGITWVYNDAANTLTPTVSLAAFSTTNLAEGTNLYFTNARADARIAAANLAPAVHTHTLSQITDAGTAASRNTGTSANNVPILDGAGKLATVVLPAIAVTDTFVVASQAAMLALSAQTGDVAVRTDTNTSYILRGTDPTLLADWELLRTPTDLVASVNGFTGTVVLTTTNITEGTNLYYTDVRADARITAAGLAPKTPQFVTLATHAGLDNERVLTGTTNQVILTDNGAGGTVVLSLPQDIATTSAPTFAGLALTKRASITVQALTVTTNAVTPNVDNQSNMECSHNANLTINNPTGTPTNMQKFTIRVNNTAAGAMTINLGTIYRFGTYPITALTQVPAGKSAYFAFVYDSTDTKWDVVPDFGGY